MPHPISPVIFLSPIVIKAKQIKEKTIPKVVNKKLNLILE